MGMFHKQERFVLRYTSDLYVIKTGPSISSVLPQLEGDYKMNIYDRQTQKVVWQNSPSERFGNTGVV